MGNTSLKHIVDTPLATTHSLNLRVWNECTIMFVNDWYIYTITEKTNTLCMIVQVSRDTEQHVDDKTVTLYHNNILHLTKFITTHTITQ